MSDNPLASIVLVRDLEKLSPGDPVPDFCKLLVEVRTWDDKLESFEFDHFGLPGVQVESLKSASQVAIIASVAGYLGAYEAPASLGTTMLARGAVTREFLSKNGFKKLA